MLAKTSKQAVASAIAVAFAALILTACAAPTADPGPVPKPHTPVEAAVTVTGTVEDTNTHNGITGILVKFTAADGTSKTAATNSRATYTIEILPGVYTVSCKDKILDCADASAPSKAEPSVTVDRSGTFNLDIVVASPPAPTNENPHPYGAYGQVTNNGVGVGGVQILVDEYTSGLATNHEITTSDSQGYYSVSDLPPGSYYVAPQTAGYCAVGNNAVTLPAGGEVNFVATQGLCGQ
jgi:hypothetical protein